MRISTEIPYFRIGHVGDCMWEDLLHILFSFYAAINGIPLSFTNSVIKSISRVIIFSKDLPDDPLS